MKTVREILKLSLMHVSDQRPRHEVEWLIAYALGVSRLDLYLRFDRPVEEAELAKIRSGISRLKKGEPLAYVRGLAPFFREEFVVSKDVLIPRPETEILVEEACSFLASRTTPGVLFDVGTGSGCIGLSVKKLFPEWNVILSDISPEALSIAKINAERLKVSVECLLGDLLSPFHSKAACVIANPPYLSECEWKQGDRTVREYEPKLALVGGTTGLEWYERFFAQVFQYLCEGSCILVEIGSTQGQAVTSLAQAHHFSKIQLIKDLAHHDRVVKAVL